MDDGIDGSRRSKGSRDHPPPLFSAEAGPSRRKTKREADAPPPIVEESSSPSRGGSSSSSDSDGAAKEEEEGVDAAAVVRALKTYMASSPDAGLSFVRKATPATVARCIGNWAILFQATADPLENSSCSPPDSDEYRNITQKMRERTGKAFTQEQIRNQWDYNRKRHISCCRLMGIDEKTIASIRAFDDRLKHVESLQKGTKKHPHKSFENHHMFAGRNVDGNLSVPGGDNDNEARDDASSSSASTARMKSAPTLVRCFHQLELDGYDIFKTHVGSLAMHLFKDPHLPCS
uniref:Uncharacterized protein n=1 Tax=Leersia perrieri TaxID=77586 RepID=A0A0D9XK36_9ORYZ